MSKKDNKQVVVKDALDRLAFDGVSQADSLCAAVIQDADMTSDIFSSFYKTSIQTNEINQQRKQLIEQLVSLPEFQNLKKSTQLDDISSALATAHFSDFLQQLQKLEEKQAEPGNSGKSLQELIGEQGMGAMRAAFRRAAEEAGEKIDEWADAKNAFGIQPGELQEMPGKDRMQMAEELLSSKKLIDISALVGRFKNVVNAASSTVFSHGSDEIVDITTGSDLSRLLPTELMKLKSSPEQFYRDFIEGKCLQYNLRGVDQLGKGPILVALDISASMQGWREHYARALTLALMMLARKERRAFGVIFFDAKVQDIKIWTKDAKITIQDRIELINRLSNGGGTSFVEPLTAALDIRSKLNPELKPADLIFITDGECELPEGFESEFSHAKKHTDLRVYGLAVGVPATMTFCDQIYQVSDGGSIDEVKDIVRRTAQKT